MQGEERPARAVTPPRAGAELSHVARAAPIAARLQPWKRAKRSELERAYEYVEGWGMSVGAHGRVLRPRSEQGILAAYAEARRDGVSLGLRGSGISYGDANVNTQGHALDLTLMNRILSWDRERGIAELEPGVTIEQLWKSILADGYWPRVVSGTMYPTVGGAAAMNIHGKNNFAVGTFGDAVIEFDIVPPRGDRLTCNRVENSDLFHAAIGGAGWLGTFSRIVLQTKKVHSGDLLVRARSTHDLREMMDYFEANKRSADYLVGWLDCFARGDRLGRGLIHHADYLAPGEDADPEATLTVAHQELPGAILGVIPKSQVWRFMRLLNNDRCWAAVCAIKYQLGRMESMRDPYRQSHAGFAFLLDYVPNWKWAYGRSRGRDAMIQYQSFLPAATAEEGYEEILRRCQRNGHVSYLGVFKRHRPDPFWLTHALDGWSLALDFPVTGANRASLWKHCAELTEIVISAGGRFYFAKDSVIGYRDLARSLPEERREAFRRLKQELDPDCLLQTNLYRRVFQDSGA
jgi:FAD/FMN-containing dehydrogenase